MPKKKNTTKKPLTNAQRQANYRKRQENKNEALEKRLNTYISFDSFSALTRLAHRSNTTKKEILEQVLLKADKQIIDTLDIDSKEWKTYFMEDN